MILPSKLLPPERSLIFVGGEILQVVKSRPLSVSEAWETFRSARPRTAAPVSFDWFCLAVSLLYAMGSLEQHDGVLSLPGKAATK